MNLREETERQYIEAATALLNRYSQIADAEWKDDPEGFIDWFESKCNEWSKSTWRLRKASMIYYMKKFGSQEIVTSIASIQHINNSPPKKRTSQKKAKYLPIEQLVQLIQKLEENAGYNDQLIAKWLLSGLLTGLRPGEWLNAKIENNTLIVKNAKFSDNRSCGEYRLQHFSSDKMDYLKTVYEFVDELNKLNLSKHKFNELYQSCRRRLYVINKQLWPNNDKHITLYTARHQFAANAKNIYTPIQIAALMGHASSETAQETYGKKRYGQEGFIAITPDEINLNLVDTKEAIVANKKIMGKATK